jgi:hypothetical protein
VSQPLEISPPSEQHEEVFLARYARLRSWALQLTKNDRELSEDLVQEAPANPSLDAVDSLQAARRRIYL